MREPKSTILSRYVWAAVVTFLSVIAVFTIWDINRDYRVKYNSFLQESQSQVRIIAEHSSRSLGEVDRAVDSVLRDISKLAKLSPANEKACHDIFLANKIEIPQVSSFFITDSKGTLKASSLHYPIEQIDLSIREYFTYHRTNPTTSPFISRPYKNRTTGKWVFVFSQRISNPDGTFAGVIGASLDLAYFESLYDSLFNVSTRRISLVRDDGYFIISAPADDRWLEANIKNSLLFKEYLPKKSIGSFRNQRTSIDASDRLVAFCKVPGIFPLTALISFDWSDLFSQWRREAYYRCILTVLFEAAFLALSIMLVRKLHELESSDSTILQLSRAVEQSPVSVVITDTSGAITYVNPKFSELTGYSLDEAIGKNPRILKTDETPLETHSDMWSTLLSGKEWRGEFFNRKKNGDCFWEMASISPIISAKGEITHFVAVKENITERKQAEKELKELSLTDEMTGLNNRRGFMLLANQQIKISTRFKKDMILVYADLDRLKWINDTFGHAEGDIAIIDAATIIKASFRVSDITARLGGDEFVALSVDLSERTEERILERLDENLAAHNLDTQRPYKLSISFGITRYRAEKHITLEELLSQADQQMYAQKQRRKAAGA